MNWLGAASSYGAVVMFALAMTPHHRAVFRAPVPRRRARGLRVIGAVLSGLAAQCFITAQGWQVGTVAVCAALSAAAFTLTLLLASRPRWIVWPAVVLLLAAAGAAFAA